MLRSIFTCVLAPLLLLIAVAPGVSADAGEPPGEPQCQFDQCLVFDPGAAHSGARVTITKTTAGPMFPFAGCPAARREVGFTRRFPRHLATVPATGTAHQVRFVVPDLRPGEYGVALICRDRDNAFVGVYEILGLPATDTAVVGTTDPSPPPGLRIVATFWVVVVLAATALALRRGPVS